MKDLIFREYDIRGIVGTELLVEEVYNLTKAIVWYFTQRNALVKKIVVGRDGRSHSSPIEYEMIRALTDSGIDVVRLGLCPSPALYFALNTIDVDGGLMITASHNTKEYNGIKVCLGTHSLWGDQIREIRDAYKARKEVETVKRGIVTEYPIIAHYIAWFKSQFAHLVKMPLKVVIDCGNGATGAVIPELIKAMEWPNVQLLFCEVDGEFPNHEADPTIEENMQEVKKTLGFGDGQIGIGFDGDGDRVAAMTKQGELLLGDKILAVYVHELVKKHPDLVVVCDIKNSAILNNLMRSWGAHPIISASGHSLIKSAMIKNGALIGGELSCHFVFKDRHFGFDDAIYAMMRLLEILVTTGHSLEQLIAHFPHAFSSKEFRIPYNADQKKQILEHLKEWFQKNTNGSILTIDGVHVTFDYGWGIVRPSNTQPVLSIRFEANSIHDLNKVREQFINALSAYVDKQWLEDQLKVE